MDRTWRRAVRTVVACVAMWAWGGVAAVAEDGAGGTEAMTAAELAEMARAVAGNAKLLAAGAEDREAYGEAERALSAGEAAFENGDYLGALAAWRRAAEQYAGAKTADGESGRPAAEPEEKSELALSAATVARTAAQNAKLLASGAEAQEAYGEAERTAAEGEAAFGEGEYKRAMEAWSRAADKYAEAKKDAEKSLRDAARGAAEAAKARTEAAKARATAEPGAAGRSAYGEAEREFAAGGEAFAQGNYEKARAVWERAEEKYGEAKADEELERMKVEKVEEALSAARAAAEDEWWEEVVRQAALALRLHPEHAEAKRLLNKAVAGLSEVSEKKAGAEERSPGTIDCAWLPGGAQLELVWCPPGTLPNGTPVSGFWIGQTEVTLEQWTSVMGTVDLLDKSRGVEFDREDGDWPMRAVSWTECVNFCEELGAKTGKGGRWRLPTETEWKWACEAGGGGLGSAWLKETSGGHPHAVGEGIPNAWGVYDMRGNVAEWCADRWGRDGTAQEFRVICGGAYDSGNTSRRHGAEGMQDARVGLRVCLEE